MDEDSLQRRIYFLTFIESLDMIFLNIEKLVKSFKIIQKWGGRNVKDYAT